tara:strand:+ start:1716 stop:3380 length:1665 start_codon:yes stop_codon:yes gene_type:complete
MAVEKIGVEFEVKNKKAIKQIKETSQALDKFSDDLDRNYAGMRLLDQITGGAVSQFQDFKEGAKGGILAVRNLTGSFKALKASIIATGIGAIVVALGLIVAYWDDIKELINGVSAEQEALLATQKESVAASQMAADTISATSNTLKLQGKSERDILNMKKAQTDETIKALEAQLITQKEIKDAQVETATRNRNIVAGFVLMVSAPLVALLALVDGLAQGLVALGLIDQGTNLAEGFVMGTAELLFNPDDVAEKGDATIAETEKQLQKLKNTRDGYVLQQQAQDKKIADEKKAKKEKEEAEAQAKADAAAQKAANDEEKRQQAIDAIQNKYRIKREDEAALLESQKLELEKQRQLAELERLDATEAQKADIISYYAGKIKDAKDKEGVEDAAREELIKNQKLASIGQTFGQVANILGKNSAAGKAAAIAAATINTYQGVTQVWKNESVLPEPFATIQKVVSTATVLASGLKTVQQIKSVPKPKGVKGGSSGGYGGAPSSGRAAAPAFNIVGGSGTNQLADTIAEASNKPSRSYVVSSDVSTAQELERKTVADASI